jgi:UDP-N-acetylmuramyl pentapeptide phosphotransferase/UDP-N-acetylglucosamine-1-phosphate transferase
MKWTLRLLALASTTVCGIFFLTFICLLPRNYNFEHHRFLPGVTKDFPIVIGVGLGFLCSGILYLYLVRNMRQNSN